MEKIQLIKVKNKDVAKTYNLVKKEGFTTNTDYLGHTDDIPVWLDNTIDKDIVEIKAGTKMFELPVGIYKNCKITKAYENVRKNKDGKEITSKVLKFSVPNYEKEDIAPIQFRIAGDCNEFVKTINAEKIEQLLTKFGVKTFEDLEGKECGIKATNRIWKTDNKPHYEAEVIHPNDIEVSLDDGEYKITDLKWNQSAKWCVFEAQVLLLGKSYKQTVFIKRSDDKNTMADGTVIKSNNEQIKYIQDSFMQGRKLTLKLSTSKNGVQFKKIKVARVAKFTSWDR